MNENIYDSPNSDLGFTDASVTLTVQQKLFSFKGRIGRSTYWGYTLSLIVTVFLAAMLLFMAIDEDVANGIIVILYIPIVWISLAIQVKRWHDRDKSGWWVLISFIPIIGAIWAFIENGCLAGTDSENQYGSPVV